MTKKTYPDWVKALAEEESKLQGTYEEVDEIEIGDQCQNVRKQFTRRNTRQGNAARDNAYYEHNYARLDQRVKDNNRKPKKHTLVPSQERTDRQDKIHAEMIDAGYVVKKQLPEYFAIKRCDDPRRPKYIKRLNERCGSGRMGTDNSSYYGFDGSDDEDGTNACPIIELFRNNPTILTLDEREEMTQNKQMVFATDDPHADMKVLLDAWSDTPSSGEEKIQMSESLRELINSKYGNKRKHYTYTTTHKRSDGVEFTETAIDGVPVEEIEKQIKEHRAEAKRKQGLIHSHTALFKNK